MEDKGEKCGEPGAEAGDPIQELKKALREEEAEAKRRDAANKQLGKDITELEKGRAKHAKTAADYRKVRASLNERRKTHDAYYSSQKSENDHALGDKATEIRDRKEAIEKEVADARTLADELLALVEVQDDPGEALAAYRSAVATHGDAEASYADLLAYKSRAEAVLAELDGLTSQIRTADGENDNGRIYIWLIRFKEILDQPPLDDLLEEDAPEGKLDDAWTALKEAKEALRNETRAFTKAVDDGNQAREDLSALEQDKDRRILEEAAAIGHG